MRAQELVDGLARCTAESWGQRIEEVTDDEDRSTNNVTFPSLQTQHNKSLDASGGSVFLNLICPAMLE
jgi:hypothetical protein